MTIISHHNEPVTTDREEKFADLLDSEGVVYRRNHVFCFNCNEFFEFKRRYPPPSQCRRCARTFCRGEYCIPDFIVINGEGDPGIKAIVMINEKVHYKDFKKMSKVRWQVKSFLDLGYPVVILREEDINRYNAEFVKLISDRHPEIYEAYRKGKKFEEDACLTVKLVKF